MRSGCKRVALRVKERSHEPVVEVGNGSARVRESGVGGVDRFDHRDGGDDRRGHLLKAVMGQARFPSVQHARGLSICGGDNFSCWGYFLVGYCKRL